MLDDQTVAVTVIDDDTNTGGGTGGIADTGDGTDTGGTGTDGGTNDIAGFTLSSDSSEINDTGKSGTYTATLAEGASGSFAVKLDAQPVSNVVLAVVSTDENAIRVKNPELTFTPRKWNQDQTVIFSSVEDDNLVDERLSITLSVKGGDDAFTDVGDQTVAVTVMDNDSAGFTLLWESLSDLDDSNAYAVTMDEGSTGTFRVKLDAQPSSDVELTVKSSNTDVVSITAGTTLTFTPDKWNKAKTVTISVTDDDDSINKTERPIITLSIVAGRSDDQFDHLDSQVQIVVKNINDLPQGSLGINNTDPNGDPKEDDQLSVDISKISDADGIKTETLAYQWYRGNVEIPSTNWDTYTLTQQDVGNQIKVRVSYEDNFNTPEVINSVPTKKVVNVNDKPTGQLEIKDQYGVSIASPKQNDILEVDTSFIKDEDGIDAQSFTYQWYHVDSDNTFTEIATAKYQKYQLTQEDVGHTIAVRVSYMDYFGEAEAVIGSLTTSVKNVNDAPEITIKNDAVVTFTEGDGSIKIAQNLTLSDPDMGIGDLNLHSATVKIENFQDGEDNLDVGNDPGTGIKVNNSGNGVLTLTGLATIADYQSLLRAIVYKNTSNAPNVDKRTVSWKVTDEDIAESKDKTSTIRVENVNNDVDLRDLDKEIGFAIWGDKENERSGLYVSNAGDFNGDDVDDMIVGARLAQNNNHDGDPRTYFGASYVVYGKEADSRDDVILSDDFDSEIGFIIVGDNWGDYTARRFSNAGDINGDGIDDLIIGTPFFCQGEKDQCDDDGYTEKDHAGTSYVIYGQAGNNRDKIELNSLDNNDSKEIGFVIKGYDNNHSGYSVSGAGDVNGDGIDDLIISAIYVQRENENKVDNKNVGVSYVVYGKKGVRDDVELVTMDSDIGFAITGNNENDYIHTAVSNAGDVNGDGYSDLVISVTKKDRYNEYIRTNYVVYGSVSGSNLNLYDFEDDNDKGFMIIDDTNDSKGSVAASDSSGAGDINADGYADLIIGEATADTFAGRSYVVYGSAGGSDIYLNTLNKKDGFVIKGNAEDISGASVSGAGDVNGDGIDDLIVGAIGVDRVKNGEVEPIKNVGASYVVYGQVGKSRNEINLKDLNSEDGFVIKGVEKNDSTGRAVSGAGDVNGDGYADLLIAAPFADHPTTTMRDIGASYVIYGGPSNYDSLNENLEGNSNDNNLVGSHGKDTLNGHGGEDVLIGGAGDDELVISSADFLSSGSDVNKSSIDGGSGEDTLKLSSAINLDFSNNNFKRNAVKNIEKIDMDNTGSTLTLRHRDVLNMSTSSNILEVDGGDTLILYNDSVDNAVWRSKVDEENDFTTYIHGHAKVKVIGDVLVKVSPTITVTAGYIYQKELEGFTESFNKYVVAGYKVSNKHDYNIDVNSDVKVISTAYSLLNYDTYHPSQDDTNVYYARAAADGTHLDSVGFDFDGYIYIEKGKFEKVLEDNLSFEEIKLTVDDHKDTNFDTGSATPLLMKTATFSADSISVENGIVIFGGVSTANENSYLSLDETVFNGLTEFTIQIEFNPHFGGEIVEIKQAYLLSMAKNRLSIYLQSEPLSSQYWNFHVNLQGSPLTSDDQDSPPYFDDQRVFINEKLIQKNQGGTLTVSINLDDGVIDAYWKSEDNSNHDKVVNQCDCDEQKFNVTSLELGNNEVIFGNNQENLGGDFKQNQAFEGKLYGLRVYNKKLHPDQLADNADSLVYSVSADNIDYDN